MIFGFIPTIACIIYNRPLPKHNAHLTDADWVVVVVTSLSTLTPTYLFVLVRGEYRRPFTYGLLEQASVRPHSLSGHEADSLTCDHLSNCPSYCQNNPYNDETLDVVFHTDDYLFIWSYWNNIKKSPCISARASSVWIVLGTPGGI